MRETVPQRGSLTSFSPEKSISLRLTSASRRNRIVPTCEMHLRDVLHQLDIHPTCELREGPISPIRPAGQVHAGPLLGTKLLDEDGPPPVECVDRVEERRQCYCLAFSSVSGVRLVATVTMS